MLLVQKPWSRCREFLQHFFRTNRTFNKLAGTVGASVFEVCIGAVLAERALETTDASVGTVRRQIYIAAFAVGFEFEHGFLPVELINA
jgi:hypothetical protein